MKFLIIASTLKIFLTFLVFLYIDSSILSSINLQKIFRIESATLNAPNLSETKGENDKTKNNYNKTEIHDKINNESLRDSIKKDQESFDNYYKINNQTKFPRPIYTSENEEKNIDEKSWSFKLDPLIIHTREEEKILKSLEDLYSKRHLPNYDEIFSNYFENLKKEWIENKIQDNLMRSRRNKEITKGINFIPRKYESRQDRIKRLNEQNEKLQAIKQNSKNLLFPD